MATIRFKKKNGAPFVDFRAHGKRHRPEFLTVKEAKKFAYLADKDPLEAYQYWMDSQRPEAAGKDGNYLSFKDKVESFKKNYCDKRKTSKEMVRVMDELVSYIQNKYNQSDVDIRNLIFEDLEDYQRYLRKHGLSQRGQITGASVNRYFTTIKTFFKRQFKARQIMVDISSLIENYDETPKAREMWKEESTPKLIDYLETNEKDRVLSDIVKCNQWSPFGPIDYARLRWKNIDLKEGMIHTIRAKGKGEKPWPVPLLPEFKEFLKRLKKEHESSGFGAPGDFVFVNKEWAPIDPQWVSSTLRRARVALGIKEVTYSTRHKIISDITKRIDRDTASRFAGHSSIKTTEKHYIKADNEDIKRKIDDAYKK